MYNAVRQVLMIPWPHYIMGRNYYRVYDTKTFGSDMVELPGFRQKKMCVRKSWSRSQIQKNGRKQSY